jgi:hypothetical protein
MRTNQVQCSDYLLWRPDAIARAKPGGAFTGPLQRTKIRLAPPIRIKPFYLSILKDLSAAFLARGRKGQGPTL